MTRCVPFTKIGREPFVSWHSTTTYVENVVFEPVDIGRGHFPQW